MFAPTNGHQVIPGNTVTTTFTVALTDGAFTPSDNTTTVVATAINNPPNITGTQAGQFVSDTGTIQPFSGVTLGDPDNANSPETVSVTLSSTNNGQFSAASTVGWTISGGGAIYTFSGTIATAQAALQALVFVPKKHQVRPPLTVTTRFTVNVTDGANSDSDNTTTVIATASNTAPMLAGANDLTAIVENPTSNPGTLVSDLIAGQVTDPDSGQTEGIAIAAVDTSHGTWQFSTDGKRQHLEAAISTGSTPINSTHWLLLAGDANTYVRFEPDNNFSGPVPTGITFRAWDGFSGSNGQRVPNSATGGATAFSSGTPASSGILVNNAPVLNGTNNLANIAENATSNNGTLVSTLIGGGNETDPNNNPLGIAVTAVDDTNGTWQYSTNGGTSWTAFDTTTLAPTSALLLTANPNTRVRFMPNTNFFGTVTMGITFQGWDQTSGTVGGYADATADGGTTAFSTGSFSAAIVVEAPPTITGAVTSSISDSATVAPFAGVTINDPNLPVETFTTTITLSSTLNGTLSNLGGFTSIGGGQYRFAGTAAAATIALDGIVFTPTLHQVTPGLSVSTTFTIGVTDTVVSATDANTIVNVAAQNTAPTLAGANNSPRSERIRARTTAIRFRRSSRDK